eukprot:TRINITY_DN8700_c0_g1_i1.p1 TRINITY_DN8700_c0_g1~~TRINITY_DN8700_c0_g1_i1.p1  ORF type:complete len:352 (+),score=75.78 TRINITY_DN8700_c0_g1_i1:72-1058(+)
MAPKKRPAGAAGDSDALDDFRRVHTKNVKEFLPPASEAPKFHDLVEILEKMDAGEEVLSWNFAREFDPMAFRVLFHSLRQSNYIAIDAIRVWKCNGGDESVRSVCYYLDGPEPKPNCRDLQFTDNGVTALGCEFLGRTLGPTGNKVVNLLRLDYNQFGTPGVEMLSSQGLAQNSTLRHLSLCYCGIGEDGGAFIAHILMFIGCALDKLHLRGNFLQNRGICDVFNGAKRAKMLGEIDVFDNKFSDAPEVLEALKDLFGSNTNLKKYNLGGNLISDAGAAELVTEMARLGYTHLQSVMVTERCSALTFEALEFQLSAGKGKKGKKKKGK